MTRPTELLFLMVLYLARYRIIFTRYASTIVQYYVGSMGSSVAVLLY